MVEGNYHAFKLKLLKSFLLEPGIFYEELVNLYWEAGKHGAFLVGNATKGRHFSTSTLIAWNHPALFFGFCSISRREEPACRRNAFDIWGKRPILEDRRQETDAWRQPERDGLRPPLRDRPIGPVDRMPSPKRRWPRRRPQSQAGGIVYVGCNCDRRRHQRMLCSSGALQV